MTLHRSSSKGFRGTAESASQFADRIFDAKAPEGECEKDWRRAHLKRELPKWIEAVMRAALAMQTKEGR